MLLLALALVAACQDGSAKTKAAPRSIEPAGIAARDADGKVIAQITPGRPCRAVIDKVEMLVGIEPLVMMVGDVKWSGLPANGSVVLLEDDKPVARLHPAIVVADRAAVFDSQGIVLADIATSEGRAVTRGRTNLAVANARAVASGIEVTTATTPNRTTTVSGTSDLVLAALLAEIQIVPEVRGLAACHRLAANEKAAF